MLCTVPECLTHTLSEMQRLSVHIHHVTVFLNAFKLAAFITDACGMTEVSALQTW